MTTRARLFSRYERLTMNDTSSIAFLTTSDGQDWQASLAEAAARWRKAGGSVVGVLSATPDAQGSCRVGYLRDIASGQKFSIQLDNPPEGTNCHLDTAGMDAACQFLLSQISTADVVILSKFGKTEITQHGLWAAFVTAAEAGKPIITTVSPRQRNIWLQFAPGACELTPDAHAIDLWWQAARSRLAA